MDTGFSLLVNRLLELHIDCCKQLKLWLSNAFVENSVLRFDKRIENRVALRENLADAKTDRNVIGVILEVENPDRCATQIVAIAELEEIERLSSE